MTGAELLALARHSRRSSEGDADTARHLVAALALIWPQLATPTQAAVSEILQQLVAQDMIRRQVRNDYSNAQARTNP